MEVPSALRGTAESDGGVNGGALFFRLLRVTRHEGAALQTRLRRLGDTGEHQTEMPAALSPAGGAD